MNIRWKKALPLISIGLISCLIAGYTLVMLTIMRQGGEQYAVIGHLKDFILGRINYLSVSHIFISVAVAFLSFFILSQIRMGRTAWIHGLLRYRWAISFGLLVLCIVFEINNTSLHEWAEWLDPELDAATRPILGVSRSVRSDEWCTWSAFAFSQDAAGYPAVNSLLSGGAGMTTAWVSIGGLPAYSLAAVFKPLYWGFLLLGLARGFSCLFAARLLLLWNISYEMALVYTRKNKPLSIAAAFLISFSPYVQWWFSQSVAEVLIFGQTMILALYRYLQAEKAREKTIWSILIAYAFGCYVMVAYPSWLISVGYLIVAFCALFLFRNRQKLHRADAVRLICPAMVTLGLLGIIGYTTRDTLMAVLNSSYPGSRVITGGAPNAAMYADAYSVLLPFVSAPAYSNSCETASFITFAPFGMILWIYQTFKTKKAEAVDGVLVIFEGILLLFAFVGFPVFLTKITLLYQVNRPQLALGMADTVLLIRMMANKQGLSWKKALPLAAILAVIKMIFTRNFLEMDHLEMAFLIGLVGMMMLVMLISDRTDRQSVRLTSGLLVGVALLGGGFVNPIQQGVESAGSLPVVQTIKSIDSEDEDLWLVEGSFPETNIPLLAGKKTLSTQVYPNPDYWSVLDPDGSQKEVYNRFCHVCFELKESGNTEFSNLSPDLLAVSMPAEALKTMGVKWLMTKKEYAKNFGSVMLQLVGQEGNYRIYRIKP